MNEIMRLFIAINFSDYNKESIYQIEQDIKKHSVKGSFTHKENLHVTLAFIGETKELENIKKVIKDSVEMTKAESFQLTLEGIGTFKRREGDIVWIGMKQVSILSQLNRVLVSELKKYIYDIDDREFKPHLTMGRRVKFEDDFDIKEYGKTISPINIEVNRISLMKSERIAGTLVYKELYNCQLF